MKQQINLKLKAYDHRILDHAVVEIVQNVTMSGVKVKGAIPMPLNIQKYTVNRSAHIDKESREQFEMRKHSRILIFEASPQIIDALMKLGLASGVEIKIVEGR